jgi:isoamylase
VEGPTDDSDILALRARQQRNFMATLLLSQGAPMLLAGDELGRSQQGNNNTYCQDNELSWVDWNLTHSNRDLLEFTRFLIRLFHQHPVLRRRKFLQGRQIRGSEVKDLTWLRPDGQEMNDDDWGEPFISCLGLRLAGDTIDEMDAQGNRIEDDTLLLNGHHESIPFTLPDQGPTGWELVLDTWEPGAGSPELPLQGGDTFDLKARSLALLRLQR